MMDAFPNAMIHRATSDPCSVDEFFVIEKRIRRCRYELQPLPSTASKGIVQLNLTAASGRVFHKDERFGIQHDFRTP
jgi:hypothetical protein